MKLTKTIFVLFALAAALVAPAHAVALPAGFFGVVPQTALTDTDASYMSSGGIESIRISIPWSGVQPTSAPVYDWSGLDETIALAARHHLKVLPFLYATPSWLAASSATLPVDTAKEREGWVAFVQAAIARYGPQGSFWSEHGPYSPSPVPWHPIRSWQIWNEANFFYFAYPASPQRYAKLVELTSAAIRSADPGAKVILSGLFGEPDEGGPWGMSAVRFLESLYRVPGIAADFDGVALHPYAISPGALRRMVEGVHRVMAENHDGAPLYITEMGWGSQNDFNQVAFEQGTQGQARALRDAYGYLIRNQRRLGLRGTFWFSWKDLPESCSFCDSVGFFRSGPGFVPKPAWRSFVALTGGRAQP